MSWHACNPPAKARRPGRWAWNLSKAQIRPAAPVRNTDCSRPIEISTWGRIPISVTSGSEQPTLYTQVPCLCTCSFNLINMCPSSVVWQRKVLCVAAYFIYGIQKKKKLIVYLQTSHFLPLFFPLIPSQPSGLCWTSVTNSESRMRLRTQSVTLPKGQNLGSEVRSSLLSLNEPCWPHIWVFLFYTRNKNLWEELTIASLFQILQSLEQH